MNTCPTTSERERPVSEKTEAAIDVAAAPSRVLGVIADFPAYPEWATEVQRITVLSEEGDGWADQVEFTLASGVIKDTYVLDYDWDVHDDGTGVVSWELVRSGVLKALTGSYALEGLDGGAGTRVTYRLAVDLAIPMLGMLRRRAERSIVTTALSSLKERAEADA